MKGRCYNKNAPKYPSYGGRGITVCDRWRDDFAAFYADMGLCPDGYSINRRENDGPYHPDNCHWSDAVEQSNNRRSSHVLTLNGESATMAEWSRRLGWQDHVIDNRVRRGWSVEDTLTKPPRYW